jgi:predicted RecB family nuclease
MLKIETLAGMSPVYAKKLTDIGIKTTEDLLKAGRSAKGREELVKKTGIDLKLIMEWVKISASLHPV